MQLFIAKIALTSLVVACTSWLAGKRPELAGFIVALPLTSLLVLMFTQFEHHNHETTIRFAKSILIGVPISWLFFVPFFFAGKLGNNFWLCYGIGITLLTMGYFLHRHLTS